MEKESDSPLDRQSRINGAECEAHIAEGLKELGVGDVSITRPQMPEKQLDPETDRVILGFDWEKHLNRLVKAFDRLEVATRPWLESHWKEESAKDGGFFVSREEFPVEFWQRVMIGDSSNLAVARWWYSCALPETGEMEFEDIKNDAQCAEIDRWFSEMFGLLLDCGWDNSSYAFQYVDIVRAERIHGRVALALAFEWWQQNRADSSASQPEQSGPIPKKWATIRRRYANWLKGRRRNDGAREMIYRFLGQDADGKKLDAEAQRLFYESTRKKHMQLWDKTHT